MTVQTASRNTSQHYSNTNGSSFHKEVVDGGKQSFGQRFDPNQQKVDYYFWNLKISFRISLNKYAHMIDFQDFPC